MSHHQFDFSLFPNNAIISIFNSLFDNTEERLEMFQSNIANTGSIRMINLAIQRNLVRVRILDFIDTHLWVRLLISMGVIGDDAHPEWCDTIKEYMHQCVREGLYTSRVHDLIDIYRSGFISIKYVAQYLLLNLITDSSDEIENQFLEGRMIMPALNNITITQLLTANNFNNIKYWDVRKVTDMSGLFNIYQRPHLDIDLTYWDTSNVRTMNSLVSYVNITLHNITNWNTCRVRDMKYCFQGSSLFNEPLNWNTSSVTDMSGMFLNTEQFNQPLQWDTSNVKDMSSMFERAISFDSFLDFNTSKVTNMSRMFDGAVCFDQPLEWKTDNVTDMSHMFEKAGSFNQPLVWETGNVINMSCMFRDASGFNSILVFDTSNVRDMSHMFELAILFDQPLVWENGWETGNVIDMSHMFEWATSFNQPLEWFDLSSLNNMEDMFLNARSFNQELELEISEEVDTYGIFVGSQGRWA